MRRDYILILLLLLCLTGHGCGKEQKPPTATPPHPAKPSHELYLEWHNHCLTGKTPEIDVQIKRYEAKLAADAHDHLARAYLGSACALRAKASFWGPTKLKYLKRGQSLMDHAVEAAPADPRVRMVRAIGSYKVPRRFNRRKIALKDFEKLLPLASEKPADLKINERQAILYYAWLTFQEEEHQDKDKAKKLCHQLHPDSHYGKLTKP